MKKLPAAVIIAATLTGCNSNQKCIGPNGMPTNEQFCQQGMPGYYWGTRSGNSYIRSSGGIFRGGFGGGGSSIS